MKAGVTVKQETAEDVWIPTVCDMCFGWCNILVHKVNGVVVKVEGNPDGPFANKRLCAKGFAGLIGLYDPSRLTKPLKRTNPEKGLGIDPKWQEIPWDEALDIVAEKLKKIREDDPRKLLVSRSSNGGPAAEFVPAIFGPAFGTPNTNWGGYFCGNYLHSAMYLTNGTFHSDFDMENCNYAILQGNQMGFMGGLNPNISAQKTAEARMRGMKVVVVDPILTNAGGKADEWIPIRPGTDGAWVNSLINVLVNELGIYDAEFIKKKTNGPYLVGPDGHYVKEGGKPLVWDSIDEVAKPFDGDARDCALDGVHRVRGIECRPAFYYFKENAKNFPPEKVSQITTIPADTIRRIAREFGEAASIGSTVVIEGHELPYRPVAMNIYRGAGAHNHGVYTALAVQALNMLMGSFYAVGGHRGTNLVGPREGWGPRMSSEGMVMPQATGGHWGADYYDFEVGQPNTVALNELLPISTNRSAVVGLTMAHPEEFKVPYRLEMAMVCRHNQLMTSAAPKQTAEALKEIPFFVYFATHKDEMADLADIVLPDQHFMERLDFSPTGHQSISGATGQFYWYVRQPIVKPAGEARDFIGVLVDLADRAGFLPEVCDIMNVRFRLEGPYKLDRTKKYSLAENYDRRAKSMFGPDMGLDWFRKHGLHKVKRSVKEKYPSTFLSHRFPIYYENLFRAGKNVRAVLDELDIQWDTSDYSATLQWRPCTSFSNEEQEDFYAVNYKIPIHTLYQSLQNPWLNELGEYHPCAYKILMNTQAAEKRGIQDGDTIRVESEAGSVTGTVKLTEGVHLEVLGIAGVFGGQAEGRPIAKGKGVHFNALIPLDPKHIDPISGGLDSCVRVKVSKVGK